MKTDHFKNPWAFALVAVQVVTLVALLQFFGLKDLSLLAAGAALLYGGLWSVMEVMEAAKKSIGPGRSWQRNLGWEAAVGVIVIGALFVGNASCEALLRLR